MMAWLIQKKTAIRLYLCECVIAAMLLPSMAYAQSGGLDGGLQKTQSYVEQIIVILSTLAVGVCTIALMVLGYRFLFGAASWGDVVKPVAGCLVIACAGSVAIYLLN